MRPRSFLKIMTWFGFSYGTLAAVCLLASCYKSPYSRLPACPKDAVWPDPCASSAPLPEPYEFCTVIGVEIDTDSGVRDDAGVWHYVSHGVSYPCDAGVHHNTLGKDTW